MRRVKTKKTMAKKIASPRGPARDAEPAPIKAPKKVVRPRTPDSDSLLESLLRAARLLGEAAQARARHAGPSGLRVAHVALLSRLSPDGVSQSDLAADMGVTKQAVGPLVAELDKLGLVKRDKNPSDRRSQLVVLTREGLKAKTQSRTALDEIESDLGKELGPKGVSDLSKALHRLVDAARKEPKDRPLEA